MKRKRTRKARPGKKQKHKRHFSIAFFIAIPGNFILGCVCLVSFIFLLDYYIFDEKVWALFATGFIGAIAIVGTSKIPKTRVFIHELKHAIVVVLTGNSLKNFVVKTNTGHVEFEMYRNKVHFASIIALAPYFFPLFSFPMLAACLIFEGSYNLLLALALGLTLATDISMAYTDLHPHQTDLQKVTGGFFAGLLYLAGTHFMWTMICLLWVVAGRNAYIYTGSIAIEIMKVIAARIAA